MLGILLVIAVLASISALACQLACRAHESTTLCLMIEFGMSARWLRGGIHRCGAYGDWPQGWARWTAMAEALARPAPRRCRT